MTTTVSIVEENVTATVDEAAVTANITEAANEVSIETGAKDHGGLTGLSDDDHTQYLLKAGGTMTGALVLAGDPAAALQAATKQYVDANAGGGDVDDLTTDTGNAAEMLRVDGAGTGLEYRTAAQVLSDIGAVDVTGDTMTGNLSFSANYPTVSIGAVGGFVNMGGKEALFDSGATTLRFADGFDKVTTNAQLSVAQTAATTNNTVVVGAYTALTSGTAAAGFGPLVRYNAETSTGATRTNAEMSIIWNDATDATRKPDYILALLDYNGSREILRARANGSAPAIGFLGATPQTVQDITGSAAGNVALQNLLTALANLGLITDSTT